MKDRTKGFVDHPSILKSKSGPQKDRTKGMFDHQFLSKGRFCHIKQLCTKLGASFFYWLIRKVDDRQWCTRRIILNNAGEGAYDFERTNHHVAYYVFSYPFFTNLVCEILPRSTNWCFPVTKQQVNSWHIPHNLASQPKAIVADKGKDSVYQIWNIECNIPTQNQHQNKL